MQPRDRRDGREHVHEKPLQILPPRQRDEARALMARAIAATRPGGRVVAAVSNNPQAAVTTYLADHGLELDLVVGRTDPAPKLLKPSPHLVNRAIHALGAAVDESALVGGSPSDIPQATKPASRRSTTPTSRIGRAPSQLPERHS